MAASHWLKTTKTKRDSWFALWTTEFITGRQLEVRRIYFLLIYQKAYSAWEMYCNYTRSTVWERYELNHNAFWVLIKTVVELKQIEYEYYDVQRKQNIHSNSTIRLKSYDWTPPIYNIQSKYVQTPYSKDLPTGHYAPSTFI